MAIHFAEKHINLWRVWISIPSVKQTVCYWKCTIEIVDIYPYKNDDFHICYVNIYQRVFPIVFPYYIYMVDFPICFPMMYMYMLCYGVCMFTMRVYVHRSHLPSMSGRQGIHIRRMRSRERQRIAGAYNRKTCRHRTAILYMTGLFSTSEWRFPDGTFPCRFPHLWWITTSWFESSKLLISKWLKLVGWF